MSPETDVFPQRGETCSFPAEIYYRVQKYSDAIKSTPEYRDFLTEFSQRGEPENKRFLKRGIANAIDTLETIYEVSCSQTRVLYLRRLEDEVIAESWIEETVMDSIDVGEDSLTSEDRWIAIMQRIKKKDMNTITRKIGEEVDSVQAAGYRRSAEVVGLGHDLIIARLSAEFAQSASESNPIRQG